MYSMGKDGGHAERYIGFPVKLHVREVHESSNGWLATLAFGEGVLEFSTLSFNQFTVWKVRHGLVCLCDAQCKITMQ